MQVNYLTGIATIPTLGVTGLGTFEKLTVWNWSHTSRTWWSFIIAGITTILVIILATEMEFTFDDSVIINVTCNRLR